MVRAVVRSLVQLAVGCQGLGWRWWLRFFMVQGLALSSTWWVLRPMDDAVLKALIHAPGVVRYQEISVVARWVSWGGDFTCFTLLVVLGLMVAGLWRGRRAWLRLGLAVLLSAVLSGGTAVLLRSGLGRARPYTKLPDTFYGLQVGAAMHAFPSGHTATSFGTALPLVLAAPRLGGAALVMALATGWSRMHLRQHRPTDVAGGIWEAVWFGVPLGVACRRLQRREAAARASSAP
jgi:membrane-associated phospholipid phosphatase